MEPVRVLQFGMTPKLGGIESFLMNYYRNMDRSRVQFDFVNMYGGIAYEDEIKSLGGRVRDITFFKKNPVKNYYEIKSLIKKQNYQIVHVNMLSAAYILPILAAKKSGARCIIAHAHSSATPPEKLKVMMDNVNKAKISKHANALFACSAAAGNWMFGGKARKAVHEVKNAIDTAKYAYSPAKREETRKKLHINSKFVIGHVGRLTQQKNHDFLLRVFQEVLKQEPEALLLLAGEGELKKQLQNKAADLGINQSVMFLGPREDVSDLMQAMDVFVFPSLAEGLGIVAIEAQAAGLPCVVADTIPAEAFITDLMQPVSLSKPASYWANQIMSNKTGPPRTSRHEEVAGAGYEIQSEASWLEQFYLTQANVLSQAAAEK